MVESDLLNNTIFCTNIEFFLTYHYGIYINAIQRNLISVYTLQKFSPEVVERGESILLKKKHWYVKILIDLKKKPKILTTTSPCEANSCKITNVHCSMEASLIKKWIFFTVSLTMNSKSQFISGERLFGRDNWNELNEKQKQQTQLIFVN